MNRLLITTIHMLLITLYLAGCKSGEPGLRPWQIRRLVPVEERIIVSMGKEAGKMRLVKMEGQKEMTRFWIVENKWGQMIGLIDSTKRAYKFIPFQEKPLLFCSGSLATCVKMLLNLESKPELITI